jgi:predicted  nucleic acid-binding Zn-ribbon protein
VDLLSPVFWLELVKAVGSPAVAALMLWLFLSHNERRSEQQDKIRAEDRAEHIAKWESMVDQHKEERKRSEEEFERLMKLYERQTSAIELTANLTARMNENILTNQFCPNVRVKGATHER